MKRRTLPIFAVLAGAGAAIGAAAQDAPFGGPEEVEYASSLWQTLAGANLVADDPIRAMPYQGREPHGAILEYFEQSVTVAGTEGLAIVKKNYGGEDLAREQVLREPGEYLESITVMFRREQGYDPENQNWFWAKYNPDGSLQASPEGMSLAGPVAGCIECHSAAPGGDYVYSYDLAQH